MRRMSVLLGALALLALVAGTASAEPPTRLDDRVTDRAGVLPPDRVGEIDAAIERLRAEDGFDLFVVFVESFDGAGGDEWANRTAEVSQLGDEDVLLAVAVGDRAYGVSVAQGLDRDVDEIRTEDVEPRLAAGDWAGATIAMADGLRTGGDGFPTGLLVAGGALAVGAGAYAVQRRRRRSREEPAVAPGPAAEPATDEFPGVDTDELAYRASTALLEVDDAVRTSEQELSAARAHFGAEAVAPFEAALQQSREEMLQAFALRQRLDDGEPEDERAQRALHAEIIRIASTADDRLDAQVEQFDQLRGLEARAPQYVAELRTRLGEVGARVAPTHAAWAALASRYAGSALEPVAGDVEQAERLLTAAGAELDEADQALRGGAGQSAAGPAAAVVAGRAAEDAITQAATLLDGVLRREGELTDAAERIPAARAEVEQDLAEARAIGGPDIAPVVARAAAAVAAAQDSATAELPDPIAALRLLGEAATALDGAIAAARAAAEREHRAAAALEHALVTARATVAAADDFIASRRGAVGVPARTRLAEAQRHLQEAGGLEPEAALHAVQQADALAGEALRLARNDVAQWTLPSAGGGDLAGRLGAELGGLVLGGILSGGSGGYRGGSRGGGMRRSPGSFGGSASRGRRGSGGRF